MIRLLIVAAAGGAVTACGGGDDAAPAGRTEEATARPAASPGSNAATELGELALTIEDVPAGSTLLSALKCTPRESGQPGAQVADETCSTGFRLPDTTAISYGSYLWDDPDKARTAAPSIAGTQARRYGGTARPLETPAIGEAASHFQVSKPSGDKTESVSIITFSRGRVTVFISVSRFGDPVPAALEAAQRAHDRLAGHFGA